MTFDVGGATVTWYAPDGSVWPLTRPSLGWFTLQKVAGLGAVPISITKDDNPRGGTIPRHIRQLDRTITWPIQVNGRDHNEYIQRWRDLLNAFTQTDELGAGILEIARPDGSVRRIDAIYEAGFDSDLPYATDGVAALSLYCPSALFYGPQNVVQRKEYNPDTADFLDPFPSLGVTESFEGETSLTNPGDVLAWPEWTLRGPATAITATLASTGESWTLTPANMGGTLNAFETVRISTNPPMVRYQPAPTPLNSNTSFETNLTDWFGFNGTLSRDNDTAMVGDYSAKFIPDGTSQFTGMVCTEVAVTPGEEYKASAWIKCAETTSLILKIEWHNVASSTISESPITVALVGGDIWRYFEISGVSPPLGVKATITILWDSTPPASKVIRVDDARIAPTELPAEQVWTGALNWPDAVLWGVPKGENAVIFSVDGATENTVIQVEFPPLYRTA